MLKDQMQPRVPKSFIEHDIFVPPPPEAESPFHKRIVHEVGEGATLLREDLERKWAEIKADIDMRTAYAAVTIATITVVFAVGGMVLLSNRVSAGSVDAEAQMAQPVPVLTTRTPTPEPTATLPPPQAPEFSIGQDFIGQETLCFDLKKSKAALGYPIGLVKVLPPYYIAPEVTLYVQHDGQTATYKAVLGRAGSYTKGLPSYSRIYLPDRAVEDLGINGGESTRVNIAADLEGAESLETITIEWAPENAPTPTPSKVGGVQEF